MKVVAFTIDRYAYVGKTWWHYFKKFWPDCPYDVVVVGQKKLIRDMPCELIYVGGESIDFGQRMSDFLENHYDEDLLLLVMMDYILKRRADQRIIGKAEQFCQQEEFGHVRLRPYPHPQKSFKEDSDFGEIELGSRYSLSLQPGIWEKDILLGLLKPGESAHHTETRGSTRTRRAGDKRFLSTMEHVYMHHNYFRRGEVNPGAAAWCKEHWVD